MMYGRWFKSASTLLVTGAMYVAPVSAEEAEDARVFNKCKACHTITADGAHKQGPNLSGIMGAKAGTQDGFRYSGALKASDVVWSAETLDAFLADPRGYIPKNRMPFLGIRSAEERADIVAYITAQQVPAADG